MSAALNVKHLTQCCGVFSKAFASVPICNRILRDKRLCQLLTQRVRCGTWNTSQSLGHFCTRADSPKTISQQLETNIQKIETAVSDEDLDSIFALRYIFVRTNVGQWEDFPEGVEFDVGYIDTAFFDNVSQTAPVILGIPSSVGTHNEILEPLITFARMGYRVVIINLPGNMVFLHVKCSWDNIHTCILESPVSTPLSNQQAVVHI